MFLGAATATLNGRLVSVGLPDLRGALGFGFDEASWIPTVLNMGMMFIGVFAAFLGAAYGIRRVLMITGVVFTVASILLPFFSSLCGNAAAAGDRGNVFRRLLHFDAHFRRAQSAAQTPPLRRRGLCLGHRCHQ